MKFSISAGLVFVISAISVTGFKTPIDAVRDANAVKAHSSERNVKRTASAAEPTGPHGQPLKYYNRSTKQFWVNGTAGAIPEVEFDVSESYSGLLPISKNESDSKLFFWFWPSTGAQETDDDLVIWLNGGPGCSSLEGMMQENGPFTWRSGTYKPVPNEYSWTNLTNMVWVEQPVGTGFTQGTPSISSEEELATQFLGFFRNFVNTFGLQHKRIWITGESYAGMYVPYIADAMYKEKNTRIYNIQGILIYDPSITEWTVGSEAGAVQFVHQFERIFNINATYMATLDGLAESCGYNAMLETGLTFPPKGPLNPKYTDRTLPDECDVWNNIIAAVTMTNPCFNVYHVTDFCPIPWDVLGVSNGQFTSSAQVYFARQDVQDAIHAPHIDWSVCSERSVFGRGGDRSDPSSWSVIPRVIENSKRTIISHGLLDYILIANGTLLAINNMTWNGAQGFQQAPSKRFVVPYENQGEMGTYHEERGLTWMTVEQSGHMVPEYQPMVAYFQLEYLLGRKTLE